MDKIIRLSLKWTFIVITAMTLSACPITVNLNVATDKPIALVVDKPIELKLDADVGITELAPVKVTKLPTINLEIAPELKDKDKDKHKD